jgi:hypothetical protein
MRQLLVVQDWRHWTGPVEIKPARRYPAPLGLQIILRQRADGSRRCPSSRMHSSTCVHVKDAGRDTRKFCGGVRDMLIGVGSLSRQPAMCYCAVFTRWTILAALRRRSSNPPAEVVPGAGVKGPPFTRRPGRDVYAHIETSARTRDGQGQ